MVCKGKEYVTNGGFNYLSRRITRDFIITKSHLVVA